MQPFHTIDVYEMCGEVVLSQGVILSAYCVMVVEILPLFQCDVAVMKQVYSIQKSFTTKINLQLQQQQQQQQQQ